MNGNEALQPLSRPSARGRAGGALLLTLGVVLATLGSATPVAARTLPTVSIGKAVNAIPFTVVDVAMAEGYFRRNGVRIKEVLLQGSSAANAAMVGGSVQFVCEGANPLLLARARGVPVLAIDALDDGVGLQMLVSNQWLAKHPVPPNATFKQKMADLNGVTVATIGSTAEAFFALLRGWAGLSVGRGYHVEQIGSQAAATLALEHGLIDVTMQSPPLSIELALKGDARDLVDRTDVPQYNHVAYDLMTTTSAYAKAHPRRTRDVATAIAQALNFIREHPNQTLALERKHYPKLSKTVLEKSLKFIPFAKDGLQSQSGWNRTVALAQQTHLIKGVKSAPEGVDWTNRYIDLARLRR